MKRLMKEIKAFRKRGALPLAPGAAIFVRQDEDRPDVMRALITGPVDTPYAHGVFLFDIFFPDAYPKVPPMVKLITTGGGRVRFNPNLYNDGKVCLSLLGTWHAQSNKEGWTESGPNASSLLQVLVSIQSLILVPLPYFNEPGREPGTAAEDRASKLYNDTLRKATCTHAMLEHLKHPPPGFEAAIRAHFLRTRSAIMRDVKRWVQECEDGDRAAFAADAALLRDALAELKD